MRERFDELEAKADEWMAKCGVKEMVANIAAVFASWASPEMLARFREQLEAIIHLSFVEGAARARITELERALNIVTGGAEAAEVRIAELEGEVERLTMERDDALFMRATLAAPCQIDGCQYSTVKGETP